MTNQFIAIDWGTSRFRAYLAERDPLNLLDQVSTEQGMKTLPSTEFAAYCRSQIQHWRAQSPDIPVFLCGMVGAPHAWATAAQLEVPVNFKTLAAQLLPAPGLENAWIIPGVKETKAAHHGNCDVMRGEEIQFLGALILQAQTHAFACAPGTHSKWAKLENENIVEFNTAMTGELYELLLKQSLIARPAIAHAPFDQTAFHLGLERNQHSSGILHALFEARSRFLYADLKPEQITSFISGVLIGNEVQSMLATWPSLLALNNDSPLLLIGAPQLMAFYETALKIYGIALVKIDPISTILASINAFINLMES